MPKLPAIGSAPPSKKSTTPKKTKPVMRAPLGAEWLTIPQAALHFSVSERTIWRWIDDEDLQYRLFGGSARISRATIRQAEARGIGRARTIRHRSRGAHTTGQSNPDPMDPTCSPGQEPRPPADSNAD